MENIQAITSFTGWCTVVNIGIYLFTVIILIMLRAPVKSIHAKISGVSAGKLDELYFNYLGNFKLAIIILNFSPYIALKLIGS